MSFEQNESRLNTEVPIPQFRQEVNEQILAMGNITPSATRSDFNPNTTNSFNNYSVENGHINIGPPSEFIKHYPELQSLNALASKIEIPNVERKMLSYQDGTQRELVFDKTGQVTEVANPDGSRWHRTTPGPDGNYHWQVFGGPDHKFHERGKDFLGTVTFDKNTADFQVTSRFDNNSGVPKHFVQHSSGAKEEFYEHTGAKTYTSADGHVINETYSAGHSRQIYSQGDAKTHKSHELGYIDKNNGKDIKVYKDQNGNWHQDALSQQQSPKDSTGNSDTNSHKKYSGFPKDSIA